MRRRITCLQRPLLWHLPLFSIQRWNFWNFLQMRKMPNSKSWSSNQPCAGQSVSLLSNGGSQVRSPPPSLTHLPKISKRKDSENEAVLSHKTNLEKSDLEKPIWNGETTRNEMRSNTYSIWLTLASAFAIWLGLGNWDIGYWGIR